jgi:hypothetical protein
MPSFSTTITIDDTIPVILADQSRDEGTAAWKRANAIFCPLGPMATRAFLLVTKSALDALTSSSQQTSDKFHTITWKEFYKADDFGGGPGVETRRDFQKMYLVKSQRLFNGGNNDKNALHLVEFCDARGIAAAHSSTGGINYNVRSYADDTDYLDGTEGHTWTTLCTALWDACGVLGAFPGMPYAPHGVPEDARFNGLNAWWSLCAVLEKLDCAVAHNPLAGTYSIVRLGAEQTIDEPANRIIWNAEPQDFPATDIPETVRVFFNNHYRSYGQERDTELATNWSYLGAGASTDVATGDATAVEGTVKVFWDDLYRQLDEDNTLVNGTAITARATERKDNWLQRQRTERRHKIFYGVNALFVGAQVRAVLWRNWGDHQSNALGGTVTEYLCRPDLVRDFGNQGGGDGAVGPSAWLQFEDNVAFENYTASDLARHSYPNYPRLPNIVQVFYSGDSAGAPVSANADGFHPGKVRRWVANNLVTLEDCWIRFVDNDSGDVPAINGANYGPARLSGMSTSDGQRLPVYTVRRGAIVVFIEFTLTANMTAGSATATIDQWWGTNQPTSPTTVHDRQGLFTRALTGAKGIAVLDTNDNLFIVLECQSKAGAVAMTLAADMTTNEANSTVNDFWGSQQDVQNPGSSVIVYDAQGLFKRALDGAKGEAIYDAIDDRYRVVECQSKAGWIAVTLDENVGATAAGEAAVTIDAFHGTQQDVQDPAAESFVAYSLEGISDGLVAGDKTVALYSSEEDKYYLLGKAGTPLWGRTQANWEENTGDPRVSVKLVANRTSTTVIGDAFYVYLPRPNGHDPNVLSGYNIPFFYDANGDAVCIGDYMDQKVGTVVLRVNESPPGGWVAMDGTANTSGSSIDARRRFIRAPGADLGSVGDVGGDIDDNSTSFKHNHLMPCLTPFNSSGATLCGKSVAEFFAYLPTTQVYNEDGGTVQLDTVNGGVNWTGREDPMYVLLTPYERINNAS